MTVPALGIRPAMPRETPPLMALALQSKPSSGHDAAFMAACRDELTVRFEKNRTIRLARWPDGDIAGSYSLRFDGRMAEVDVPFVELEVKRSGTGRILRHGLEPEARLQGMRILDLDAVPQAVAAKTALIMPCNVKKQPFYGPFPFYAVIIETRKSRGFL